MHKWLLGILIFMTACPLRDNPSYCDDERPCEDSQFVCDLTMNRCISPTGPFVSAVEPPVGPNRGGISITLRGKNFQPGMRIAFNGVVADAATVAPDGQSATATLPPS